MPNERQPNSTESRLERFFRDNPDEELSVNDIMDKFDCTRAAATQAVSRLRARGLPLELVRVPRKHAVYRMKAAAEESA